MADHKKDFALLLILFLRKIHKKSFSINDFFMRYKARFKK